MITEEQRKKAVEWVKALRCGTYKQGRAVLRDINNKYCCLGVACDISGLGSWEPESDGLSYRYLSMYGILPYEVMKYYGINRSSFIRERKLIDMNDDDRCTFEQIAVYIEDSLEYDT